ncbi:hypothetical protein [Dongia sp.]|uniref:hypothetical protein n=1 Tax=Dongia sp. TaxID=1977262 RepID=UPI0035B37DC8
MAQEGTLKQSVLALGGLNKAWAAAVAAPLADWLIGIIADQLWAQWHIAMPDSAAMALTSLIVGLIVYRVPNLPQPSTEAGGV